jgi:putative NADH-flavin reductase
MKLVIFGASGKTGRRIVQEALRRGHQVTAVARDPTRLELTDPKLQAVAGNVLDAAQVASLARGHDSILSAVGPSGGQPNQMLVDAAHSLLEGANQAGVRRIVVLGGAGSLEVAPGVQAVDTAEFPLMWKGNALAQRDALAVYRTSDLDWTYISPAGLLEPGERTGNYRVGGDQMLFDGEGKSRISSEDYAVAMLDEVENPRHIRKRMTAAY